MTLQGAIGAAASDEPGFGELRAGKLGVRIATSDAEMDAVQALRFRVFFEEMGAKPDPAAAATGRDRDGFDAVADHLLVVDHAICSGPEGVVGTYRLIRREAAQKAGRFYSADEYDLSVIEAFPGRVLELGRSCVDAAHRIVTLRLANGRVVEMLARDEVRNFDQIHVGDKVHVEYMRAMSLELIKGGSGIREAAVRSDAVRAPAGAKPGGYIGESLFA